MVRYLGGTFDGLLLTPYYSQFAMQSALPSPYSSSAVDSLASLRNGSQNASFASPAYTNNPVGYQIGSPHNGARSGNGLGVLNRFTSPRPNIGPNSPPFEGPDLNR
jgi:hypothetical protein